MAIRDALLAEYDHEMATTRRLLERVPEAELAWKPHEKSMGLGELADHIANIPHWCSAILEHSAFDISSVGPDARPKAPASVAQLLSDFDARISAARAALAAAADPDMLAPWTLRKGDQDVALPSIYGPTADEA